MNGVPAGASSAPARSLTMPAHPDAAGDQITGGSPLASGFGQPSRIRWAASPDATLRGRTNDAPPVDLGVVAVVELLGQLGQERDLLAADRHVDRRCSRRGRPPTSVASVVVTVVAASRRPTSRRAGGGDDGCNGDEPRTRAASLHAWPPTARAGRASSMHRGRGSAASTGGSQPPSVQQRPRRRRRAPVGVDATRARDHRVARIVGSGYLTANRSAAALSSGHLGVGAWRRCRARAAGLAIVASGVPPDSAVAGTVGASRRSHARKPGSASRRS